MANEITADHLRLPLGTFIEVVFAWLDSYDWSDDGFEHRQLSFETARCLKGHPQFQALSAEQAYEVLRNGVRRRRRFPIEAECIDLDSEDFEVAFHTAWERVRFPAGTDPVAHACKLAGDGLLRTQKKRPGRYHRFLTVAALLQLGVRERPIMLPVHKVAEHMPCQANTVSSWTRWAIEDEVLVRTAPHAFRSAGDSRAAEYVFGLHCWDAATIERVADLLSVNVSTNDRGWTRQQFEGID